MSLLDRLYYRVRDILDGEDRQRIDRERLDVAEDGMITLIAALTMLLFLALAIVLGNAAEIVNQKIEVQNAADAVAMSAATQKARGLNAVTGINHMVGELLSLVVAHNAIAGDDLPRLSNDRKYKIDLTGSQSFLQGSYTFAQAATPTPGPTKSIYDKVHEELKAEAAVRSAQGQLQYALGGFYILMGTGGALQKLSGVPIAGPILYAIGTAMAIIAKALEVYAFAEWAALKVMFELAKATAPAIKLLFQQGPRAANMVVKSMELQMPGLIQKTGEEVAKMNGTQGAVLKGLIPIRDELLRLPLTDDPMKKARSENEMKKSQLVRASWPWVVHHRGLLFDMTVWMVFSSFRYHYKEYTEKYMLKKSYEVYSKQKIYPRVLEGWNNDNEKGKELWTKLPPEAERRFAVLGFAKRASPVPWGGPLFRQTKPRDMIGYAQALVYNANEQNTASQGSYQREIGWDTLNWENPATQSNAFEFPNPENYSRHTPKVKLNWQVKLIPVTRLRQAKSRLPGPFRELLRQLDPSSPRANTH